MSAPVKVGLFMSERWGPVRVLRATYDSADGPMAIVLQTDNGEPLATLSVNMYTPECSRASSALPADCFFVKQWGGNETLAEEALASGMFRARPDLGVARSGYVAAPAWQLIGGARMTALPYAAAGILAATFDLDIAAVFFALVAASLLAVQGSR